MLAFTVQQKQLKAVNRPQPGLRKDWARVRVRLAGICNTDVEILRGYHDFRGTPGHEFVGEVVEVRTKFERTRRKWQGQRVVGEINISCSAFGYKPLCSFCQRGLKIHCERRKVLGIVEQDGAFAEMLALPLENLHRVPDGVSDEKAVFTEPLAAACEILMQIRIKEFPKAAVLGDGKLAQLIAMVLSSAGSRVTTFGKHVSKLRHLGRLGIATRQVRGDRSDFEKFSDPYRLVVEATGSPSGLTLAQHLTEPRGTLVLKSTFHGAAPVETWPIVVKELTVLGSRCGPFAKAMALLKSGAVDPTPMISRIFPLKSAPRALRYAQEKDVLKVLLKHDAANGGVSKKRTKGG